MTCWLLLLAGCAAVQGLTHTQLAPCCTAEVRLYVLVAQQRRAAGVVVAASKCVYGLWLTILRMIGRRTQADSGSGAAVVRRQCCHSKQQGRIRAAGFQARCNSRTLTRQTMRCQKLPGALPQNLTPVCAMECGRMTLCGRVSMNTLPGSVRNW